MYCDFALPHGVTNSAHSKLFCEKRLIRSKPKVGLPDRCSVGSADSDLNGLEPGHRLGLLFFSSSRANERSNSVSPTGLERGRREAARGPSRAFHQMRLHSESAAGSSCASQSWSQSQGFGGRESRAERPPWHKKKIRTSLISIFLNLSFWTNIKGEA